jgi:Ca2+-binding RTX toxin-like protein
MTFSTFNLSNLNGSNGFVINGIADKDESGRSVSGAGDVNGDGFDDLLIDASTGQRYVVFGGSTGFASGLSLSSLNGSNGFILNADVIYFSTKTVSGAGDVNGDGFDDLLVGVYRADTDGKRAAGQSYVVFGASGGFASSLNLSSLNGSNGFVLNGAAANSFSGFSVSGAGDVNGDGLDDLLIGAPTASSISGESYVVFGRSSGFGSSFDLSSLNGSNGFAIKGIGRFDQAGHAVSSAGDFNGDGFDDLLIGAKGAEPNGTASGQSYVVFGGSAGFAASLNLSSLNGSDGFAINGIAKGDNSGWSVSGTGDVNGDGLEDVLIGAFGAHSNGTGSGQSYIVFGHSGGFSSSFDLSSLNGSNGFTIDGLAHHYSGWSVSGAGDVNGDGIDDLVIGAPGASAEDVYAGKTYVVFGSRSGFAPRLSASNLNGSNGFIVNGRVVGDISSVAVSAAGDVNGDGIDDLLIGASVSTRNGSASSESYVVFGSIDGLILNRPTVDASGVNRGGIMANLSLGKLNVPNPNFTVFVPDYLNVIGTTFNDTIIGNASDNNLQGNSGNDTLSGELGSDTLDGGAGNDVLVGGQGDDFYIMDSPGDITVEAANQGTDTVRTVVDHALTANVERLGLKGTRSLIGVGNDLNNFLGGNTGNNSLDGQAGADTLQGNIGSDTLDGGTGDDVLIGNRGSDFYWVDSVADFVQETSAIATEIDTVRSSVSYSLGINLERLGLKGTHNIDGTGNASNNFIAGNIGDNRLNGQAGNDILTGDAGNDVLIGAAGNDTLSGGQGNDSFHYATGEAFSRSEIGVDLITDFKQVPGNRDKIILSKTTFTAGTTFASVATDGLAGTSGAFITFSTSTGNLFYNPDGAIAGFGNGGKFATITNTKVLTETDFSIIA